MPATPRRHQFDESPDSPVVFNREYARGQREGAAADHSSAGVAGRGQRSITRAITSKEYRGGEGADGESPKGTVSRWAAETAGVGRWAREQGLIIPKAEIDRLPVVSDNTAEHRVHYDAATDRAVKVTEPSAYGTTYYVDNGRLMNTLASPVDYAKRWETFNRVFDDQVAVEGFTEGESDDPFTKEPAYGMVISQPWYEANDKRRPLPTEDEVCEYMERLGFVKAKGFAQWYRRADGVYVGDARDDNFMLTKEGVRAIDLGVDQLSQAALQAIESRTERVM